MGVFILLISILAFTAGGLRNELVLILTGAVFFAALAYCFVLPMVLIFPHRKRARSLSARIVPQEVSAGKTGKLLFSPQAGKKGFFRLPGIVIRYEMNLQTRDGRLIREVFDPDKFRDAAEVPVEKRGAYFGAYDGFTLFDALGLFRIFLPVPQDEGPRLLALPAPAGEFSPPRLRDGGGERRAAPRFLRTDDLIDHRPYIPGDDPRRINWKLYGHAGDLFVREEEREPPPHGRLTILVDTQTDPALYPAEAGRNGADLLCGYALAGVAAYAEAGMEIAVGYTGGSIRGGSPGELAAALAYPSALPLTGSEELPLPEEGQGILILALPRAYFPAGEPGAAGDGKSGGAEAGAALDRFLKRRGNRYTDICFLYGEEGPAGAEAAAETCVNVYNRKGGVYARRIRI
jgi:hypothetical protein